jgi:transcriptional regulator with XRE-family HTH domain
MAATNKLGPLLKEARTKAGLTQEQLARKVPGVSAADISEAERGKSALTQDALKQIAKVTGVTQKSLLDAPKNIADTGKTSAAKTSSSGKTSSSSSAKTSASSSAGEKLTTAEKRVLELYRAADAATKKNAEAVLKGTKKVQDDGSDLVGSLLGGALEAITGLGKK